VLFLILARRSSNNDDHEIFVEKSRLDLEEQYGQTETGRRISITNKKYQLEMPGQISPVDG
jgi:acyl-coenzyme A synthetase/AMP-(fatty) acid ligase